VSGAVAEGSSARCSILEAAAVVSLAVLLQGMLIWQFVLPGALSGSRSLLVGSVAAALNLAVAVRSGLRASRRTILMSICLLAAVIIMILSMSRFEPSPYGVWKTQGFVLYAVMPSMAILWNHRNRPACTLLLYRCLLILAVVPLFLPLLLRQVAGTASMRWLLLHLDYDIIGISRSLGVGGLLALTMAMSARRRNATLLGLYSILLVVGQIVVGERGPLLALICGLAALFWPLLTDRDSPRSKRMIRLAGTTTVIVIGAAALIFLFVQRLNSEHQENRLAIARQGWVEFQSSPLWGIGTGHFRYNEGPLGTRQFVHNLVGEVLIETGVVGLVVFGSYFVAGWRGLRRNVGIRKGQRFLRHGATGLFVFALVCAMVSGDITTNYLVWVSQALLVVTFSSQAPAEISEHRPSRRGTM
jgi:hypothetical protein